MSCLLEHYFSGIYDKEPITIKILHHLQNLILSISSFSLSCLDHDKSFTPLLLYESWFNTNAYTHKNTYMYICKYIYTYVYMGTLFFLWTFPHADSRFIIVGTMKFEKVPFFLAPTLLPSRSGRLCMFLYEKILLY